MFPVTIYKLQLCFETIFAAVGVHKKALSAFWPSKMICYFPVIFSLASTHKANYLTEPHAGLCACIHPTQELQCSTATSSAAPRDALSQTPSAWALYFVLWVSFSE